MRFGEVASAAGGGVDTASATVPDGGFKPSISTSTGKSSWMRSASSGCFAA